jgi:hypothetical protein
MRLLHLSTALFNEKQDAEQKKRSLTYFFPYSHRANRVNQHVAIAEFICHMAYFIIAIAIPQTFHAAPCKRIDSARDLKLPCIIGSTNRVLTLVQQRLPELSSEVASRQTTKTIREYRTYLRNQVLCGSQS